MYKPIALLNVDVKFKCNVKLLSSILADRPNKIMPDIVDLDQTGFIKIRPLSENVRRTLNIIELPGRLSLRHVEALAL